MGIKSTLSNIEYLQEQREQREISEKEQREIEKQYKKTLNDSIEYYFIDIFDTCKDIEYQYNDFILNNTIHINNIYNIIIIESEKHYKIITNYTWEKGMEDWKREKKVIYLWDQYDIEHDIFKKYYEILKKIYNIYKIETDTKEKQLLEILKNELIDNYKKNPYKIVHDSCYKINMDHEMSQYLANNSSEYLYLKNNYYKILDKIDSQYKKIDKQDQKQHATIKTQTTRKKTIIEKNAGLIMGVGFISGLAKGFKNASID